MPRIEPLEPPFDEAAGELLGRMMPGGAPPIALFRLLARHPPLAEAAHAMGRHQLSRSLSLGVRDREIVIDRTTARDGAGRGRQIARQETARRVHPAGTDTC